MLIIYLFLSAKELKINILRGSLRMNSIQSLNNIRFPKNVPLKFKKKSAIRLVDKILRFNASIKHEFAQSKIKKNLYINTGEPR